MKDFALIVRVPGSGLAQNIEVLSLDGSELAGEERRAAGDAIQHAGDVAGGIPVLTDGDCYLDQESRGGDLAHAVGVIVSVLVAEGFPVRVVLVNACERCGGAGADIPGPCPGCNNRGVVEYERPPTPVGDA